MALMSTKLFTPTCWAKKISSFQGFILKNAYDVSPNVYHPTVELYEFTHEEPDEEPVCEQRLHLDVYLLKEFFSLVNFMVKHRREMSLDEMLKVYRDRNPCYFIDVEEESGEYTFILTKAYARTHLIQHGPLMYRKKFMIDVCYLKSLLKCLKYLSWRSSDQ